MGEVPAGERVQKLLAAAGVGSRRTVEEWIRAGRVTVNGRVVGLGDRARAADAVCVDGRPVALQAAEAAGVDRAAVLIYHKPVGEVTSRNDPQGRPTVFEQLPPPPAGRWVVVGRLDFNTAGLLLFTNDGALAHGLMHPSREIEREYLVRVRGSPDRSALVRLQQGVELEDGPARFDAVEMTGRTPSHTWFRVVLHEGRNREVRRLWSAVGHEVSRLTRIRYGNIDLPRDLPPGRTRRASAAQVAELARLAGPQSSGPVP